MMFKKANVVIPHYGHDLFLGGIMVKQGYSGLQATLFAAGLAGFILLQWCI